MLLTSSFTAKSDKSNAIIPAIADDIVFKTNDVLSSITMLKFSLFSSKTEAAL
jgi:hypothetical protein